MFLLNLQPVDWKSLDGFIEDSSDVRILGADMSPKTCDYEISIDLVSFGVDTATRDGKQNCKRYCRLLRQCRIQCIYQ